MKNEKEKFIDASKTGLGLLTNSILEAGTNMAAGVAKESVPNLAGELMMDTISSALPGISGAISSYKRLRMEKNIKLLIYHLHNKHEQVLENLNEQTEVNRKKLDELLQFILEMTTEEYQEEKIEYMVNGYIRLTKYDDITSDFVMLYYDTLKQLRMVDISVLRLYYKNLYYTEESQENKMTFNDVMAKHGMTYDQYNSVRETLRRVGLLEVEIKDDMEDDMNKLAVGINKVVAYIDHLNSKSRMRPPKISQVKIKQKTKERIKLSKFGHSFYQFFGNI